jgi:hypothetical protein
MLESQSADVFAALIVQEGMMSVLYTLIVKHVQRYYLNKAAADFIKIKASSFKRINRKLLTHPV